MQEITNCEELRAAIAAHNGDKAERQYLIKKSIDLGCVDHIPDEWEVEVRNG